ncbi:hypothetical protein EC968_007868 [Mortierella alpina]|nr:hypothetical protein EC968_007868 [Mortierella alpina]
MAVINLARVSALAILFPLAAIQNKATWHSSIVSAAPAPLADTIDGAHILLENDVDSATAKNSFLLLSKPREYKDTVKACEDMFETLVIGQYQYCQSFNKGSGELELTPCEKMLPTICFNTAPRRTTLYQENTRQVIVKTNVGAIQGFRDQNSFRFLGIKYAEAPIGKLRFATPVPKAPFESTFDATAFGHICPQVTTLASLETQTDLMLQGATQDDDCLVLNVFTPSLKSKGVKGLPVIVYFHGGGFSTFSGSTASYEPGNLVSRGGVVVVTFNFRLGILGFTENSAIPRSDIPGNQAIHDQILALKWVKDHIANFGGDPTKVTLFGESSGAVSIRALLSAPSSWDLYSNVIMQSGFDDLPFKSAEDATEMATYFFDALKCASTDVDCARSKPIADIMSAQMETYKKMMDTKSWVPITGHFMPTAGNDLISADFSDLVQQGQHNTKVNIMWGTTKDDCGRFLDDYLHSSLPGSPYAQTSNYGQVFQRLLGPERQKILVNSGLVVKLRPNADAKELFSYIFTAYYLYCPLQSLSKQIARTQRLYHFRFDFGRNVPFLDNPGTFCGDNGHVCHMEDIIPSLGSGTVFGPAVSQTGDDARFSRQIIDRITSFAKTGDPNPSQGLVGVEKSNPDVMKIQWLRYSNGDSMMKLALQSRMSDAKDQKEDKELCGFLEEKVQYDFKVHNPTHPE